MQLDNDVQPWQVRALLESTGTPFRVADYGPRANIYRQGDPCGSVMYIESGHAWLAVSAHNGKEAICDLLRTGAFLGDDALIGAAERRHSARAMIATRVLVIAKAHMNRLLRTQSGLLDRFVTHLLARNIRLEANLSEHLLYSSKQRLAHLLLVLAGCDERGARRRTLPGLTQEILADMVGTTRGRVNVFMRTFKKLGFIEENSGLLYVNPDRLQAVTADRRVAAAASPALPPGSMPEVGHWPLAPARPGCGTFALAQFLMPQSSWQRSPSPTPRFPAGN